MPEYIFYCNHCAVNFSHVCSMSEFSQRKYFRCPSCKRKGERDFSFDNIQGSVSVSLSDCKTIGHYAEKQSAQYGKQKVEDMMEDLKTKKEKEGGMSELPTGMSRIETPSEKVHWTKDEKKKRPVNKNKRRK